MQLYNKAIYSLFVLTFILQNCSVQKYEQSKKYLGRINEKNLELFFNDNNTGVLILNETKDTIKFNYSITKDYIPTMAKDDSKKKNVKIYKYVLSFSEENINQFKELEILKELYKLKKKDNFSLGGVGNVLEMTHNE